MDSFFKTYIVVFGVIFAFISFIILVIGLGGGEIFDSSLKNVDFDSMFQGDDGCLGYLLGTAIYAFIITAIMSMCGLIGR